MKSNLMSAEIAEPYARALMSIAESHNLLDQIGEDTRSLLEVLQQSGDLRAFLESPIYNLEAKKTLLRQAIGGQVHPYMLNFLLLLVDRGRIYYIDRICQQFQTLLRQLRQTVLAEVTSAIELNDDQKNAIRHRVMGMTQAQQVDLETRVDPGLIGGVIIKVGSQVVDASVRGQLRRIGVRLSGAS